MPEPIIPIKTTESFRLDENVEALTWNERDGFHGCLRWAGKDDTNFVGPYPLRSVAIAAVKSAFLLSVGASES